MDRRETGRRPAHPVAIRVMHWIWVYAMGCMIFSGWEIYNASPSLPFLFPAWTGLGGWLGGALAWHLSAMWLLFADGIAYLVYGFASGHFRRDLKPPRPAEVVRDVVAALRFRLQHRHGALQRRAARAVCRGHHRHHPAGDDRARHLEAGAVRLADWAVRRLSDRPRHPPRHHVRHRRLRSHPCRDGG